MIGVKDRIKTDMTDTLCGITDDEMTRLFRESVRLEEEVKKIKGVPIAKYDPNTKEAYLLYPDGRKEYVK